jgi:hypothetical protein
MINPIEIQSFSDGRCVVLEVFPENALLGDESAPYRVTLWVPLKKSSISKSFSTWRAAKDFFEEVRAEIFWQNVLRGLLMCSGSVKPTVSLPSNNKAV